jgi:hypothetical protein
LQVEQPQFEELACCGPVLDALRRREARLRRVDSGGGTQVTGL